MKKKIILLLTILLATSLVACSTQTAAVNESAIVGTQNLEPVVESVSSEISSIISMTESGTAALTIVEDTHEESSDYTWDTTDEIVVELNGTSATAENAGVSIDASTITITAGGTYRLSGSLSNGQVIVNSQDDKVVRLILDGAQITSNTSAPLYITDAEKVIVLLADNSQNTLTDGNEYTYANVDENEPNAAIYSTANLTIYGNGELTVNANFNDGIASKDGLIIANGTINVNAADDGIRGQDYVVVKNGAITINATGDGLKSDNDEDTTLGYIVVENGELVITTGGDAITAQTSVVVDNGSLTLVSGGGSATRLNESLSAKGIKGASSVTINGGAVSINSADDSIHSNGVITINSGTLQLASGDDGMHADTSLTINNGEINVTESYEGIESAFITINNGKVNINASDDGINVAAGMDGSGMMFGGRPGSGPGQDAFNMESGQTLTINGGYVVVNADGDGLDVNGTITMINGIVLVDGPTNDGNGALDYMGTFSISGGTLVAIGSAGMAQSPSEDSTQNSVLINLDSTQQAGTIVNIQDESGNSILTYVPAKTYQSIVFSSSSLETGGEYIVNIGGTVNGEIIDGLAQAGVYSGGSQYSSFSVSSPVSVIGTVTGFGPGGMPGGGGRH